MNVIFQAFLTTTKFFNGARLNFTPRLLRVPQGRRFELARLPSAEYHRQHGIRAHRPVRRSQVPRPITEQVQVQPAGVQEAEQQEVPVHPGDQLRHPGHDEEEERGATRFQFQPQQRHLCEKPAHTEHSQAAVSVSYILEIIQFLYFTG